MPLNPFKMTACKWKSFAVCLFVFLFKCSLAQKRDADTIKGKTLGEVIIRAYEQNRRMIEVPASINFIGRSALDRFGNSSEISAINTTPGVRMEERSPGSYRFTIRGSSLRSPFGVRNVKVYFNDLPYTDPSGNTYLNQLSYYNFNSLEIIKGPGSSLYGAGTGGVLLIQSLSGDEPQGVSAEYTTGSYHYQNIYAAITTRSENLVSRAFFQHQESNGYRDHSRMKRDVHSWTNVFHFSNNRALTATYFYGNLYYQTPGGLTRKEYDLNPRMARPSVGPIPSADAANASVTQKTFLVGASYVQPISSRWENKSTLYGAFTELRNPGIRNYGKNSEPHVGVRTAFNYQQAIGQAVLKVSLGGEFQQGFFTENVFKNVNGNPDSLQTNDEINNRLSFVFAQASLDIRDWIVTAGGSWNQLRIQFQRFQPNALPGQSKDYNNEIAPRLSILKKCKAISIYSSVSRGFSPPSTAELFPTGSAINLDLNAEQGINYDLGLRGTFFRKIYADVNAFFYSLHNAIVQRRDAAGGDYYINSGKTRQEGLETYISYPLLQASPYIERSLITLSYTFHNFHYVEFKQIASDFSGNRLPGEPQNALSAGFDLKMKNGFSCSANYYFSDKVPLNDANTDYADPYHLVSARVAYEKAIKKIGVRVFVGSDNILNIKYSLGNDINAAAGRYYNVAAGRNYYTGVSINYQKTR